MERGYDEEICFRVRDNKIQSVFSIRKIAFYLVCFYCFLIPLGDFQSLSALGGIKVSTIILLSIVVLMLNHSIHFLVNNFIFLSIFIFLAIVLISTCINSIFIVSYNVNQAFHHLALLLFYVFFAASVSSIGWSPRRIYLISIFLSIGFALSIVSSFIDFFGIYDIPGINDTFFSTYSEEGHVLRLNGPYSERTTLAVYFSLIIPFLFFVGFSSRWPGKLWFWGIVLSAIFMLLSSHNRSAPIAIFCSVLLLLFSTNINQVKIWRILLIGILVLTISIWIFVPDLVHAYTTLFGGYMGADIGEVYVVKSDLMRFELLKSVFISMAERPYGAGFSDVYSDLFGMYDPHSVLGSVLHAGGVMTFLWGVVFIIKMRKVIKKINRTRDFMILGVASSLVAWLLVGLMHNVLYTGLFWLFFGVYLSYESRLLIRLPPEKAVV